MARAIETVFSVYAPPEPDLPFLSVVIKPGKRYEPMVTSFDTAAEAESFNTEMVSELRHGPKRLSPLNVNGKGRVPVITAGQARAARGLLNWTSDRLSEMSGVGLRPIERFERCDGITKRYTVATLRAALEAAGIEFTSGDEPGVKLKKLSE